jgi:CheY-like chemotaxis protein
MNLMIVDDHAGVRRMIRDLLAVPGEPLAECNSADAAVRQSADFQPDVVTMDIRMPGRCAFAATRAIRTACPGAHVIIVTSYDEPDLRQSAREAGAAAYVMKDNLSELPGVYSRIKRAPQSEPANLSNVNSMKRLLLVDTDDTKRAALGMMFSEAGFHVHQTDNGNDALKIHRENPVDVIITEMLLPEMDGIELLMTLRRQPSPAKIIAMTAGGIFDIDHCLRVAKHLGAHHVLAKPFQPERLLAAVESVLRDN